MPGYVQGMRRPEVVQNRPYSIPRAIQRIVPYRIVDRAHLVEGMCRSSSWRDSSALANVGMAPPPTRPQTTVKSVRRCMD